MRKLILSLFWLQISLLSLPLSGFADEVDEAEYCSEDMEKIAEKEIGAYQVRISFAHDRTCQALEIRSRGHIIFRELGIDNHYYFGDEPSSTGRSHMRVLLGSGRQLAISKWTGGAHCCYSLLLFDLGSKFRKIAEIEGGNFSPELVDLNHDGIPEIQVTDDFLAYVFSSFAGSALGTVILKYSNGRYLLAEELMKRPPPPRRSWRKETLTWVKDFREKGPNWPPEAFVQALTDLVFTGNSGQARNFVDQAWPKEVSGKEAFINSYKSALASSRYFAKAAEGFGAR